LILSPELTVKAPIHRSGHRNVQRPPPAGERLGVLERGNLKLATHPRRDGRPILADTTIEAAARQLDLAEAIAEVYKTDPQFVAPQRVYEGLRRAAPDLL
jgi:hypothetical protein